MSKLKDGQVHSRSLAWSGLNKNRNVHVLDLNSTENETKSENMSSS